MAVIPMITWVLAGSPACGLKKFETSLSDEATLPGTIGQPLPITGPEALGYKGGFNGLNLAQERNFQNNGVKPGDVDSITVISARLQGTKSIDDLGALLMSVELWVEGPTPDLPRKTIATITEFGAGSNAADFTVMSGFNLKPYAVAPSMKVGTNILLKQRPAFDTTLRTTIKLLVDIHLL